VVFDQVESEVDRGGRAESHSFLSSAPFLQQAITRKGDRRSADALATGTPAVATKQRGGAAPELVELLGEIAGGAGKLVQQQWELLRAEVREELGAVGEGAAVMGAGAVLAASGGVLSAFMLVHGLQRATRLPLWACYGLVGGALGAAGMGLIERGRRQVGRAGVLPRTTEALQENLAWIEDQLTTEARPPTRSAET
jgi:hypothetical protein